jgi:hypothetical protein
MSDMAVCAQTLRGALLYSLCCQRLSGVRVYVCVCGGGGGPRARSGECFVFVGNGPHTKDWPASLRDTHCAGQHDAL